MMIVKQCKEEDAIKYGIKLSKHTLPLLVENNTGLIGIIFDESPQDDESATIYLLGCLWNGTHKMKDANLDYWRPLSPSKTVHLKNAYFNVEPNFKP